MSNLRIQAYAVGRVGTNCYIVYRENLKNAIIVDPGDNGDMLLEECRKLDVTPEAILLTHGHFDHILAVADICREFMEIKIYAAEKEMELLENPAMNLSSGLGEGVSIKAHEFVKNGDELGLCGMSFKVLETPGHTSGSVCYWNEAEGVLFSGDTLFAESFGRTDFPTGSRSQIVNSIKEQLFLLPDETTVYPGHGSPTTIEHEKKYNLVLSYKG